MPVPKSHCSKCKKKMVYDAVLSNKGKQKVFWCMEDALIVVERTFEVELKNRHDKMAGMPVTSVRRFIFHGKLPE
jgi:hypothetical protein